jgi:hypothetical protein
MLAKRTFHGKEPEAKKKEYVAPIRVKTAHDELLVPRQVQCRLKKIAL